MVVIKKIFWGKIGIFLNFFIFVYYEYKGGW